MFAFQYCFSDYSVHLLLNRTNFDYLQEVPILTLDVNEDFKDKHESMVEKVCLDKKTVLFIISRRMF